MVTPPADVPVPGAGHVLHGDGRWGTVEALRVRDRVVSLRPSHITTGTPEVVAVDHIESAEGVVVATAHLASVIPAGARVAVLRSARRKPHPTDVHWVPTGDLAVGDVAVTLKALPHQHKRANIFAGRNVTLDLAWLLGYLVRFGWVSPQAGVSEQVTYTVRVAARQDAIETVGPRLHRVLAELCPQPLLTRSRGSWHIDDDTTAKKLLALGYPDELPYVDQAPATRMLRLPHCVWRWAHGYQRAFLWGLAAAAGNVLTTRSATTIWRLTGLNPPLVHNIHRLALSCGIRPTIQHIPPRPSVMPTTAIRLPATINHPEGRGLLASSHPNPHVFRYERITNLAPHTNPQPGCIARTRTRTRSTNTNICADGFFIQP